MVECFRRIALTGFAVFIIPDSSAQIAIVLLLAAVFMVVSEILAPFARPVEMWLYRAGHYVVFASMYLALLLRVDVSDERDQSQEVRARRWIGRNGASWSRDEGRGQGPCVATESMTSQALADLLESSRSTPPIVCLSPQRVFTLLAFPRLLFQ